MARRLLLVTAFLFTAALFFAADASQVSAQGFISSGYGYGVPLYGSRYGAGYGSGYVYDPYASGSFQAPDMHNDPLFQAQHKFDSHFPGRYTQQQKLEFKSNVPQYSRPVPSRHHHHRTTPRFFRNW
ncbi:hypothetical protein SAMN06265222_10685 [Neorhodopirellula lusitana]|uniref:Secreted protein n=1 Tax=Neorhodopirellula lusitana TaxID=445327 RepID=A0ABY1Q4N5_9BACT|nr:hypothetical protein [Neorhodopirellula lusitana]SMP58640.1 hypothetical protein SAMN06265222_10685 [Neorhodopirellula lusitana]